MSLFDSLKPAITCHICGKSSRQPKRLSKTGEGRRWFKAHLRKRHGMNAEQVREAMFPGIPRTLREVHDNA